MKQSNIIYIFVTLVILLVFIKGITQQDKNPINLDTMIKIITANTKVIDANEDHNQALDVSEYAKLHHIKLPKILINFDTHSDIFLNYQVINPDGAGIENWINEYVALNPEIDEIYWVMPKEEALNTDLQILFALNYIDYLENGTQYYGNEINENLSQFKFVLQPLTQKSFVQYFLIDPKTGILNEYIENSPITPMLFKPGINYKLIKITACTETTLPDFSNKEVFLSIDADYISNSGFDTTQDFANNRTPQEIEKALFSMIATIYKKNIRPTIISMSLSPEYVPREDHPQIIEFFNKVFKVSNQKDILHNYKRNFSSNLQSIRKN